MSSIKRLGFPLLVLVLGLSATIAAIIIVADMESERRSERFGTLADTVASSIEDQLDDHRLLLRGVAAFLQASESVGRLEFRDYVNRLRLPENHPGTLGIGFSLQIDDERDLQGAVRRAREEGVSLKPWPLPFEYPGSAILLLEPQAASNRRAIGFNMYGEAVRRQAMARAMRTGEATLSGKVVLVQDDGNPVAGFLIYVPVSPLTGARPGTVAFNATGWAYSPLRAHEIVGAALAQTGLKNARLELFDGKPSQAGLLYRDDDFGKPRLSVTRVINFGGRQWTVHVGATKGFFDDEPLSLAWVVALSGALLTFLLATLTFQQARAAARTQDEVDRATEELRAANEELIAASRARDEAEAQLRQAQKLEALGQLTGGIAHDFNNMLAVILGNLDMATRRLGEPDRLKRALSHAQEAARRAAELTQRLLAFGRRQPLIPQILDPNQLVADMSVMLRRTLGESIELRNHLVPQAGPVEADPGQLENAILNLAINARDAMPRGGLLTISTRNVYLDESSAATDEAMSAGEYCLISVADTGSGMSPDVTAKALDPFFTTKDVGKGSGLGLSQVFGFVRQSGGHLKIESEVDLGTTVQLYLPRAPGPVVPSKPPEETPVALRGDPSELIIVAEDQEDVRLTTVESLRDLGYTVVHAEGGHEALEQLKKHGGAKLLLTDVVMPGMNGGELSEKARILYPDLKVVFTTGYAADVIVRDGRLAPDVVLLPKPFTTSQLAAVIRGAIEGISGNIEG